MAYCSGRTRTAPPVLHRGAIEHFAGRGAMDIESLWGEAHRLADRERLRPRCGGHLRPAAASRRAGDSEHFGVKPKRKADGEERIPGKAGSRICSPRSRRASSAASQPLLTGLGIRHVGGEVATLLATRFGSLSAVLEAEVETLASVDGVGEVIAASIVEWAADESNRTIAQRLIDCRGQARARARARRPTSPRWTAFAS